MVVMVVVVVVVVMVVCYGGGDCGDGGDGGDGDGVLMSLVLMGLCVVEVRGMMLVTVLMMVVRGDVGYL